LAKDAEAVRERLGTLPGVTDIRSGGPGDGAVIIV